MVFRKSVDVVVFGYQIPIFGNAVFGTNRYKGSVPSNGIKYRVLVSSNEYHSRKVHSIEVSSDAKKYWSM